MHQVTHYLTNPCEALHHLLQKKMFFQYVDYTVGEHKTFSSSRKILSIVIMWY